MDDCTFCNHTKESHTGNDTGPISGCSECHCAVYTSPEQKVKYEKFIQDFNTPVSVTPKELGRRIHALEYGRDLDDHGGMSCPCDLIAMFYLGVREPTGVYWPDGKGGNTWKR